MCPVYTWFLKCVFSASPADHLCSHSATAYVTSAKRSKGRTHSYYTHTLACHVSGCDGTAGEITVN